MSIPEIKYCPGILKEGYSEYSNLTLKHVFNGRKVSPILNYNSPASKIDAELFNDNQMQMSISGVQEKFSVLLDKNKIRLIKDNEQGTYILKPIPSVAKHTDQMPANEHLTMQIASQVFGIETAENALMFFKNGEPVYLTKRFDVQENGQKLAQEDFATLAHRTSQTHSENYKYLGSYLELFQLLKVYVPAYQIEAIKLFRLILFNYLVSNGDAHFKNFSLIETPMGDFKLSPAYDLLNSRIHIDDKDFALEDGLLPTNLTSGRIKEQFFKLGELSGISIKQVQKVYFSLTSQEKKVIELIDASYLNDKIKRNFKQAYQTRLKKMLRN
ncbi:type II toxin-antitoxin system HipA family toxin [Flavivirga sp. 57AJ16]|uniref:type II toxin-antitoxin system HipA family toxin n=1 Tax=Flavivirga sp. 57AJ16 TaxID=3025307 RepID=UPI0023660C77|nr:HipA domain-containing protein [Flavivirga sp. 57AJ16]MDD7886950.1 HipA domain-containing protein [Flavivirga sp. 57AJ16]